MLTLCWLYCRSSLFMLGMVIATVIHGALSLLTFPLPSLWRYRFITLWSRFIVWWAKVITGVHYQLEGLENIPESPAIILCKHQSMWETVALQVFFPPQVWVLKRELLTIPFFGWALRLLDPIAINRSSGKQAFTQLIDEGQKRLDAGRWIVIFPEGTRMPPGEVGRYRAGGAALAQATQTPILPIAHNAGLLWPRRGFLKYPGTIRVVIGPLIEPGQRSVDDINQQVKAWIEEQMQVITE
jgi:1-acyl-sn-glycerol-3-phosphate acyltransferase